MNQPDNKYFAFISYNSKDLRWGQKLQHKLEHYRMPATLCNEKGWNRTPIRPIFFAPTDIQPGGLTHEIRERLRASKHLIVICSPNSAKSEWVGKEIAFFHELGRTENIHFFIVDGEPHSGDPDTECFNPIVSQLGLPEILGANIHENIFRWSWLNQERAYVQLISKLLSVEFDSIWKRHRRLLVRKAVSWVGCLLLACLSVFGVWTHNRPVDVGIQLHETSFHNEQLPPLKDAIVKLVLANEEKTDTIRSLGQTLVFSNIPHHFIGNEVRITIKADYYLDVDMTTDLQDVMNVGICRDTTIFGNVRFRIWDQDAGRFAGGKTIEIAGHKTVSDNSGLVQLYIPLKEQNVRYLLVSDMSLECDTLYMPCGRSDVVLIK